jgi:hypothetical protein
MPIRSRNLPALTALAMLAVPSAIAQTAVTQPGINQPGIIQPTGAEPSPADAAVLRDQLRGWFSGLLSTGPLGAGSDRPIPALEVSAEKGGFRIALPLLFVSDPNDAEASLRVRPLRGGRWAVDSMRLPSNGAVASETIVRNIAPGVAGKDKAPPDGRFSWSIGSQQLAGEFDPAFGSPAHWDVLLQDISTDSSTSAGHQTQSIGRYAARTGIVPDANGRLDFLQDGEIDDWTMVPVLPDQATARIAVRRAHYGGRLAGLNKDSAHQFIGLIRDALARRATGPADAPPSDADRAALHAAVLLLRDVMSRIEVNETLDDIAIDSPAIGQLALQHLKFGFGGEAPGGLLHAWMDIAVEGISSTLLPPQFARYLPGRIIVRPAIAGLATDAVMTLLTAAVDEKADGARLAADGLKVLTGPAVDIGLEFVQIQMDPLSIQGTGRLRFDPAGGPSFEAHLSATGLGDKMAEISKDPAVAQVMPFIIMARGLGRPDGDRLVWDIVASERRASVNGVDVMNMVGSPPGPRPSRQ